MESITLEKKSLRKRHGFLYVQLFLKTRKPQKSAANFENCWFSKLISFIATGMIPLIKISLESITQVSKVDSVEMSCFAFHAIEPERT